MPTRRAVLASLLSAPLVLTPFGPRPVRAQAQVALLVWHCHILSHEDHEMMRPFVVRET
jgi:hypothetical protein